MKILYKGQKWWNGDDEGSHSISNEERNSWTFVHVAEGITTIEAWSFHRCRNLKYVYIPDTVEVVEKCAFAGCSNLVWVRLPKKLKMIGWGAFYGCRLLPSLIVPSSCQDIDGCAFAECQSLVINTIPMNARVGRNVVLRCRNLLDSTTFMTFDTGVVDENSIYLWLKTRYKHLPLHDICARDDVSVEKIYACFLQHGAEIGKIIDDHHGLTALHVLVANPYATNTMVQVYLRKCEGVVTIGDTRWWTLLHFLSMNPKLSVDFFQKCVEKGAYNVLLSGEDRNEQLFMKLNKSDMDINIPKPASVVLVGCWDKEQGEVIQVGSGFIAETHHGFIVTSRSNVDCALGRKENLVPIIGVTRKGTSNTVWQYYADIALSRNSIFLEKNLDCCILQIKSKFIVPIPTNNLFFGSQKTTEVSCDELDQYGCLSATKERPGRCVLTFGYTSRTNRPVECSTRDEISSTPSFIFGALDSIDKELDIISLKTSYRRGISGAPCLNQEGQVIGIVTKGREEYADKCKLVSAAAIRMGLFSAVNPYSIRRHRCQESRYDHLEYKKKRAMRRARREQAS